MRQFGQKDEYWDMRRNACNLVPNLGSKLVVVAKLWLFFYDSKVIFAFSRTRTIEASR